MQKTLSALLAVALIVGLAGNSEGETYTEEAVEQAPNPHYSRYFFAPTAFPLQKGNGYIQTTWLVAWSAHYGIADYGSVGFMTTPVGMPFFLTPKIGVRVADKWYTGGGVMLGYVDGDPLGVGYGLSTWGDIEQNLTLGLGWAFGAGDVGQSPLLSVNAMKRFAGSWMMMFESWIFTEDVSDLHLLLYGVRWHRGGQNSLDLGFIIHREFVEEWNNTFFLGVPYFGWTFGF